MPFTEVADGATMIADCPDGVTIGGGGVIAALPPPQPAAETKPKIARSMIAADVAAKAARRRCCTSEPCLARSANRRNKIAPIVNTGATRSPGNGVARGTLKNGNVPLVPPLVATVTINGAALPFVICRVAGP